MAMAKNLDEENKEAPNLNPEKSGMRSGNPQLDPERDAHDPARAGQKPHRPEVRPDTRKAPNR
jgi:hypothetical protein